MDTVESLLPLGVALAIGLVIGLEREQFAQSNDGKEPGLGGARTFPIVALAGAASMLLSRAVGGWLVGLAFISVMVFVTIAYADDVKKGRDRGITTEAALVMTFLLGALTEAQEAISALTPRLLLVAVFGVAVVTLLSVKAPLHGLAKKMSREDLYATIKFLVVLVVALPLLPDKAYGPFNALNPYQIALAIALIAGVGFAGYVAVRVLGPGRGLGITGLVGGLVSSTAVMLAMAEHAKKEPAAVTGCALSAILASTIMCIRVGVVVALVAVSLLPSLAPALGAMAAGGVIAGIFLYRQGRGKSGAAAEVKFENPFELSSALKFGAIYAVISVVAKAANIHLGNHGNYVAGLVAGLADVDAITLSTAKMSREGLAAHVAAVTIIIALASNTLVKAGMAFVIGGRAFGLKVLAAFGLMLALGAVGLIFA